MPMELGVVERAQQHGHGPDGVAGRTGRRQCDARYERVGMPGPEDVRTVLGDSGECVQRVHEAVGPVQDDTEDVAAVTVCG